MLCATVLLMLGCDEAFSPKGPFEQKVAVFGILSNGTDTQYVRVIKTYDPSGYNPYEITQDQVIQGATVSVSQGGTIVRYRQTTVPRANTNRFSDNILAYVAYPYKIRTGKLHMLTVETPSDGMVSASIVVPDTGYLKLLDPMMLSLSRVANGTADDLGVQAFVSPLTYGVMIRFFIDYDTLQNSTWVRVRSEVPKFVIVQDDSTQFFVYPKLLKRTSTPGLPGTLQVEGSQFSIAGYKAKLNQLRAQYGNGVWFRRVLFVLTQVDRNLYVYYNIANGYQDAISIRTDMPDWTNINGGLGVFGAMVTDSVYYDIPD